MKIRGRLTYAERVRRAKKWHRAFAWMPIEVEPDESNHYQWVWLSWYWRRMIRESCFFGLMWSPPIYESRSSEARA